MISSRSLTLEPYSSCSIHDIDFVPVSRDSCSLVNQTTRSTALDVLHHQHAELVMQYIQRCGGSGLVHETRIAVPLHRSERHECKFVSRKIRTA